MSKKAIILIGGGGHCISCIDVINSTGEYNIIGILDIPEKIGEKIGDIEIIGTDNDIPKLLNRCPNFLITVGQIRSSHIRADIFKKIKRHGGNLPVIVSSNASVSSTAVVKEGTIIMNGVVVNSFAKVGRNCIINTGCLIEHESIVGDNCHISTHAVLNGQVNVGSNCFVGSNAVIANNLIIKEETIISAGAVVLKSNLQKGVLMGNPAQYINK